MVINETTPSWEYVINDMKLRNIEGMYKYNRFLRADCPDDMLQHLYEELLDAAVYIKTLINQRELGNTKDVCYNIMLNGGDK